MDFLTVLIIINYVVLFRTVRFSKYDEDGYHRFGVIEKSHENKVWRIGSEPG
jgi:hypothetical protein